VNLISYVDPEINVWIDKELERQENTIELIASENFVCRTILDAQGSIFTNKYAEGYPDARYHGGCQYIDEIEKLAIERAKKLFGADHVNVQPHSGVNANLAVYMALLRPGDTILGMDLKHGGHLSHGSKVSITGQYYKSYSYGVKRDNELIDYDQIRKTAHEHNPKMIIAGASAYSREIDFALIREIAHEVGAYFMVDMAHIAGLVAAGIHKSPVPYADVVTSTTTKTLRGARGGFIICKNQHKKKIDSAVFPGTQGGPIVQNVLAKAITFKIAQTNEFREYQLQTKKNASLLASMLQDEGFRVVSGGTDNHLFLVDVKSSLDLTGLEAEERLSRAGIAVNKNLIPYDALSPRTTSGIRIGTAAVTSRGFREEEIERLAEIIVKTLRNEKDISELRKATVKLCYEKPLYLNVLEKAT
jgi:glycine hydroxymethyltransferase